MLSAELAHNGTVALLSVPHVRGVVVIFRHKVFTGLAPAAFCGGNCLAYVCRAEIFVRKRKRAVVFQPRARVERQRRTHHVTRRSRQQVVVGRILPLLYLAYKLVKVLYCAASELLFYLLAHGDLAVVAVNNLLDVLNGYQQPAVFRCFVNVPLEHCQRAVDHQSVIRKRALLCESPALHSLIGENTLALKARFKFLVWVVVIYAHRKIILYGRYQLAVSFHADLVDLVGEKSVQHSVNCARKLAQHFVALDVLADFPQRFLIQYYFV